MSDLSHPWQDEVLQVEMLQAIAVPAWLHREDQPLLANTALMRLGGLTPETLSGASHLTMLVPSDRDTLQAATHECLHGSGEPPAQWTRLLTPDGSERPVELTLRRISAGSRSAVLVSCVDHSDFLHVQNMLQSMSGLLRQIVDGAPTASFVIDRNRRITHWNTACAHLTGCSAETMIGSTEAWRAFFEEPRQLVAEMIVDGVDPVATLAANGTQVIPSTLISGAYETEAWFPKLAPEGRWLNFTSAPLRDQDQMVVGAIVTLQDVSQRRRTEAELTRRLERMVEERSAEIAASARVMDAFIDHAPIGVVLSDGIKIRRSNRKVREILGLVQEDEAITAHDFHLGENEIAELMRQSTVLREGRAMHHEMWMRNADGRPLWVQIDAHRVDADRPDAGIWWMLQDRTEIRSAQEELRSRFEQLQATHQKLEQTQNQLLQSDKMASIGQLAAGVAHEINNPVGFVSSNLHTLRQYVDSLLGLVDAHQALRAAPDDAPLRAQLQRIEKAVELDYLKEDLPQLMDESADGLARVRKIVQDLKDFSRVDQADWQQADLNAGLESTLNVVRHEVKYKADVVRQLATLPLVTCLAGQLNQVFMNLIVNASHAIAERGVITLSTGVQGAWAWVQVDDTGCGMSEEVRRRIFEPFFTTKDVGKGTGLGLSLTFSIVQRHGGSIEVRSTVGVGSSFRVWVPVAGPAPEGSPPLEGPPTWT